MKKSKLTLILLLFNAFILNAQVGINTLTPNSTLSIDGSFSTNTDVLLVATTLDETHHTVISNNTTITLPSPDNIIGREYLIKAGNTGNLVVAPSGTDFIDGTNSSITLNDLESIKIKAIGASNWIIIKESSSGAEKLDDLTDVKVLNSSVYLGQFAGNSANGTSNVSVGEGSLISSSGNENVALGAVAGVLLATGNNNLLLGHAAGSVSLTGITSGSNNIMIGSNVAPSAQVISNELNLGDAIYATGLYGSNVKVGVGNTNNNPNSTLSVNGSLSLPINSGTTAYTLTDNDYTYLTDGADVTLPSAIGREGRIFIVKNVGSSTQTIFAQLGETIDGSSSISLTTLGALTPIFHLQSDGSNWWVISRL